MHCFSPLMALKWSVLRTAGHPRRREYCFEHNELLNNFLNFRILYYCEGKDANGTFKLAQYLENMLREKDLLGNCCVDIEYDKYKEDKKKISNGRNIEGKPGAPSLPYIEKVPVCSVSEESFTETG